VRLPLFAPEHGTPLSVPVRLQPMEPTRSVPPRSQGCQQPPSETWQQAVGALLREHQQAMDCLLSEQQRAVGIMLDGHYRQLELALALDSSGQAQGRGYREEVGPGARGEASSSGLRRAEHEGANNAQRTANPRASTHRDGNGYSNLPRGEALRRHRPAYRPQPPPPPARDRTEHEALLPVANREETRTLVRGHTMGKHGGPNCFQAIAQPMVESGVFSRVIGSAIILNAMLIGLHCHWQVTSLMQERAIPTIQQTLFEVAERYFLALFGLEMILRTVAEQGDFFCGANKWWNLFDFLALLSMVMEVTHLYTFDGGWLTHFSALRVVQLFRAARIIRIFRFIRQLRFMLFSVLSCLASMSWAMLLMGLWIFLFALFIEDTIQQHLEMQDNLGIIGQNKPQHEKLMTDWNGMGSAMRSILYSITGGQSWGELVDVFWEINPPAAFAYVAFMIITVFGLLNVLVAIFVEEAHAIMSWDTELVLESMADKKSQLLRMIGELYDEMDPEGLNAIRPEAFTAAVDEERVQSYFLHLQIDYTNADLLFSMLDENCDGIIDRVEFVEGCMRMHGEAKSTEAMALLLENKELAHKFDHLANVMSERIDNLALSVVSQALLNH